MVCLSSRGPNSAKLLRYGSRLAGRLNRNWYAVYVQTPSEEPTVIDARTQRLLSDTLTLANQLGATVFTFKGQDVADTILRFAREYRVANIIIGRPRRLPWWRQLIGQRSVAEELIRRSEGVSVIVVNVEAADESASAKFPEESLPARSGQAPSSAKNAQGIGGLLTADRIVIWDDPVSKADIFRGMARVLTDGDHIPVETIVNKLDERERTGSTFLNEGIALPHVRLDGLTEPRVALGLTRQGVLDAPAETPIEVVFMLLSPSEAASTHLQLLAKAGRLLQNRELHRRLAKAKTPPAALQEIRDWQQTTQPAPSAASPTIRQR